MSRKSTTRGARDSLASALALSSAMRELPKQTVEEGAEKIVIDRSRWKEKPVNDENEKNAVNVEETPADAEYWKEKFESLRELRETEPERELEEFRRCAQEREAALVRTIRLLEQKLSARRVSDPEGSFSASPEDADARIAEQETLLQWYETLTCMKLKLLDEDEFGSGTSVLVTALNREERRLAQVVLTGDEISSEITHSPEANVHELPEFLQQDVTFHSSQAPMYVCSILNKLHNHDESS